MGNLQLSTCSNRKIDEKSKETLLSIQTNDADFTALDLAIHKNVVTRHGSCPRTISSWKQFGILIGNNVRLRSLTLKGGYVEITAEELRCMKAFCRGLSRNQSISTLAFCDIPPSGVEMFSYFRPFFESNPNLENVTIIRSGISNEGMKYLCDSLRGLKCLKSVKLNRNFIDFDLIRKFIATINELPELTELNLSGSMIDNAACTTLAKLLTNPKTKLKKLDLSENAIDDDGIFVLVNALKRNSTLESLDLCGLDFDMLGWEALATLVCDTSSINSTFCSNHTIRKILPRRIIKSYLALNQSIDKGQVARQKVMEYHFVLNNFDVRPFMSMDPRYLVHVMAFFSQTREGSHCSVNASVCGQSVIYELLRNTPQMFHARICGLVHPK